MSDRSAEIRAAVLARIAEGGECRFGEPYFPVQTADAITRASSTCGRHCGA